MSGGHKASSHGHSARVLLFLLAGLVSGAVSAQEGDAEIGERIYWEGVGRDGEDFPVTVQGDVRERSSRFTCVGCHRPSGFGSSEGGQFVPPITQPILFNDMHANREHRNRRFRDVFKEKQGTEFNSRVRLPDLRPAYTEESLAQAIRNGVDPTEREFSEAMPRYDLGDQAMADLIAYLKTLSAEMGPGITDEFVHIATVIGDDVDPVKQQAVIDTVDVFVKWYNQDIAAQQQHPGFSPYYRSEFNATYRHWKPHIWRLEGPQSEWREQLQSYYAEQPVFAVVSGIVEGPWAPVDEFCEGERLPCLFPNTNLPATDREEYGYSMYFSRGFSLEAEALAAYLDQTGDSPRRITQINAAQPAGVVPAQAFAQALGTESDEGGFALDTHAVEGAEALGQAIESAAAADNPADVLVIWPGDHVDAAIQALNRERPENGVIVLPSTALSSAREDLSPELYGRVRLTHPYEKPDAVHPRRYRVRAWMRTQRLNVTHARLQLQTYYALTQMQFGFDNLLGDNYRDYLLELIEHEAEANLNPGVYPTLSLGPGQRFASKGAYIVELTSEERKGYRVVSDWIVP